MSSSPGISPRGLEQRTRMRFRSAICTLTAALTLIPGSAARAQSPDARSLAGLKTRPSAATIATPATTTTSIAFLERSARRPKTVHLTTLGKTYEGRALPLAVIGAPDATPRGGRLAPASCASTSRATSTPAKSRARNRAQILLRDLAEGKHADWLQSMVLADRADLQRRRQRALRDQQPRPRRTARWAARASAPTPRGST